MSYVKRRIDIAINLGEGDYGEAPNATTVTLKALRVSAQIQKTGMPGFNTAQVRIYGMTLSLMNQLTTLGKPQIYERKNTISVNAGDDVGGMALVFAGIIQEAWADFNGAPEVFFAVTAQAGSISAVKPVPPASYGANADAVVIMSSIANVAGMTFENNGVPAIPLPYAYYPGTARIQAEACARAAGIGWTIDDGETGSQVLAIWPANGARGGAIPLISPATGMIGYPSYTATGIRLRTLYNPSIRFNGQVKVDSSIAPANGTWTINALSHDLNSETPGAPWFTDMQGYRFGSSPTLPS